LDPLVIDLISKVLVYIPNERLTPIEALLHPYFDEIRKKEFYFSNFSKLDLFNFTKGKKKEHHLKVNSFVCFFYYHFKEELFVQPELEEKLVPSWFSNK
jgi:serine/threonine protein kinase